ncbi:MAG: GDP-mannose 4,6-dehydratase, partial [Planctomycetes bacterium]|nr:GDP-mannose 4,6-dehydratase [Planctomycetota bacterium]
KGRVGEVYNFGGASEMPNLEVVRTILRLLGKPESLIRFVEDRKGHDRRYAIDFEKARQELGFEPQFDFAEGLEKTVAWYCEHREWWERIRSGEYRNWYDRNYGGRGEA